MHIHNKQPTDLEVPISPEFKSLTPESFNGFLGELFNSSPEGVLIVDHARRPLLVNNKMVEFWDFPSGITTTSEALDLSIDKVEDPIVFRKRIEEIYADVHCESQEKIKLKNGRIYQRNTKPLLINGNHVGRFWTYRDITAEYQVEVALKESEAKYRVLYDNEQRLVQELALLNKVRAAIAQDLELPSLFQHVVESIAESFGFALVGLYLLKDKTLYLQHQVGYDQVISTIPMSLGVSSRVIQSGKPVLIEDTFNEPGFLSAIDGIVSEICVPLFDNEKVVGVLNVESINHIKLTNGDLQLMISLSEHINSAIGRARLFTEVKTQEKQLLSIFDLAPIGFLLCSIDGMFVQVNKAFENTLGYSSAELKKMKFTDITHPEDIDNNLRWVNRLIGGEITTYGFEKRYIHKNGSSINAFLQVSMLPTQENQPARLIAQVVNLTDLKKAESALLQHQKMEGISVFAGGIAHDFNNLLVTLKAQSSLALLKLPADSAAKKHIEKVKLAADSAAQLTEQLLAYTGQRQFKLERTDLNHEVRQNSQLHEVAIPKNVRITNQLASALPKVMADKGQIQQILMNLIINSAESMDGNAGGITISTEEIHLTVDNGIHLGFVLLPPAPGPFVVISVTDNGSGMDNETLLKIFDPFFTTKFVGRGLGLAAVLGIVRSHNGALFVTSRIDSGTTFKIYFPVAATQENNAASVIRKEDLNPPQTEIKKESNKLILLIDDDNFVQETMVDLFELENIPVVCAANGTEGITKLQVHKDDIAVVILDLSMPGISSEETFTELRKINKDLPIFLCSGYSELKVNDNFSNQSYEGFIAKPFDINKLIKTIRTFL